MFFLKTHKEILLFIFELIYMSSCLTFGYLTRLLSLATILFDHIEPSIFYVGYSTVMEFPLGLSDTQEFYRMWLNWWFMFHISQPQAIWCFILKNYLLLWRQYEILGSCLIWQLSFLWMNRKPIDLLVWNSGNRAQFGSKLCANGTLKCYFSQAHAGVRAPPGTLSLTTLSSSVLSPFNSDVTTNYGSSMVLLSFNLNFGVGSWLAELFLVVFSHLYVLWTPHI